ncbi:outer membrane protein assembly factor BamB family protein [Pyxidicoccus xibeiensis]|uniref:outer membrane protein assembly factor BamB family protein n=1 Tax=Pyxidicoccus xibeiensis TaxID=2906759 RepID=UPI002B208018|nr:PQQ-binding-like beta-propeller repeat protein [Pyxidicoccus xibeiensis]
MPLLPALALTLVAMAGCREPAETAFRYSTDASSRAGLVALADGVITGNEAGTVVRLDRLGLPVWRVALGREVATRPALAGDSVIVGTVAGDLVRLSISDGAERWRLTGEPPVLTPIVADEEGASVYLVAPDGAVRAHAVDTGKVRWRYPAPKTPGGTPEATRALPSPVLSGGLLVVSQGDAGLLLALSTADGSLAWQRDVRDMVGMVSWRDALYASTRKGGVLALSLRDGSPLWEQAPAATVTGPPSVALGTLWVGTSGPESAWLVGLALADGKEVARVPLPAPLVSGVASVRDEVLLVPTGGREGRLVALKQPGWERAFTLRTDTPLRTRPVVLGDQVFVLGLDGRVLSWRLRPPEP